MSLDKHAPREPLSGSEEGSDRAGLLNQLCGKIALAFIHRNEGQLALEMLASVLPIVGFVSFVDTSSDDGSYEMIQQYLKGSGKPHSVKIIQRDTFDKIRNVSLDMVPDEYDWILVMDADEVLLSRDYPEIAELVNSESVDAWSIPRFNWVDRIWGELSPAYPDYQTRLFKNKPVGKVRYKNKVHELPTGFENRIASSEPRFGEPLSARLHIHHIKLFRKTNHQLEEANRLYQVLQNEEQLMNAAVESVVMTTIDFSDPGPQSFDTSVIRTLHSIDLETFGAPRSRAFWAEWNHPLEGARHLSQLVAGQSVSNWARFIKPGSCCIDIGAHSGDTAIPMAILASDIPRSIIGSVVVAEPNPDVFKVLTVNLALNNHLARFKAVSCAITRSDQAEVTIADHGNANCNGGILDVELGPELESRLKNVNRVTFKVRGLSLSSFVAHALSKYEQKNLSFVKMDCEGYDKEILWGAKELITSIKPVIMVEWFDLFNEEQSLDLFASIEHIGYAAYEAHSLQPASAQQRAGDLVIVPKTRVSEFF